MGLTDLTSKVLTIYKADTRDHINELNKLKGAEKERAKATIAAHKELESSLESQIKTLGKVAVGVGAVLGAVRALQVGFEAYAEHEKLSAAAVGVDMEKLRKASLGLKTETQLLADAAKFKAGAFKTSSAEMAIAEKAMISLTRKGHDAEQVHGAILHAVAALKTEGLQDLGIFIDKAGLSMEKAADRGEIYRRLMTRLREETVGVNEASLTAAERMQKTGVEWENAMDKLKVSLGKIAVALTPVVEAIARLVDGLARIVEIPQAIKQDRQGFNKAAASMMLDLANKTGQPVPDSVRKVLDRHAAHTLSPDVDLADLERRQNAQKELEESYRRIVAEQNAKYAKAKGSGSAGEYGGGMRMENWWESSYRPSEQPGSLGTAAGGGGDINAAMNSWNELQTRGNRYAALAGGKAESRLESMFGPIDEFNAYKTAFDTLSGAVGSALTAWIDGSMSAGEAFKRFVAEAVKGIAVQMAMESLKHAAYAIGDLAFGNPAGAAVHGKAAAAFAAGAIVAASAAKALGGGGGGGSGAGAAAPVGGAGGGGGGGYRGQNVVYVIGDSFGETSPRARALSFRRRHSEAFGASGVLHE